MPNTGRTPGAGIDQEGHRWQLQQDGSWYSVDTGQSSPTMPRLNTDSSTWDQSYLDEPWSHSTGVYNPATGEGCIGGIPGNPPAPGIGAPPATGSPPMVGPPPDVGTPPEVTTPVVGTPPDVSAPPGVPGFELPGTVQGPQVTPAPEYQKTPEQLAWEQMYGGQLQQWVESGGYGIPDETKAQIMQSQTDMLRAREQEQIRTMRNEMDRRGLTNSGFLYSNEQKIKAATTEALARSMTDVEIQSALMKTASYERALGQAGQFLGYLAEESMKAYAPQLATWQAQTQSDMMAWQTQAQADLQRWKMEAEQSYVSWQMGEQRNYQQWFYQEQAKLAQWDAQNSQNMVVWQTNAQAKLAQWSMQAQQDFGAWQMKEQLQFQGWATQQQLKLGQWQVQMDMHKFNLAQAYTQQNMLLEQQIRSVLMEQQFGYDRTLMELQVEASNKQATMQGIGGLFGTIIGAAFGK